MLFRSLVKRWEILTDAYSKNWAAKTSSQDTFAMGKSLFYWGNTYDARQRNTVFLDLKQKGNLGLFRFRQIQNI